MRRHNPTALLVSNNAADASRIQSALASVADNHWLLEQVGLLSDGISRLNKNKIAAVLLDLYLPDSEGMKTFELLFAAAPLVPIVVLTNRDDEIIAWHTTRRGAAGYLSKHHLDAFWLPRILNSVIEHKQADDTSLPKNKRISGRAGQTAMRRRLSDNIGTIASMSRKPARRWLDRTMETDKSSLVTSNDRPVRRNGFESKVEELKAAIRDHGRQDTGGESGLQNAHAASSRSTRSD